ncbi:MAG TPA: flagellar basal body M-ring protein FliF [Chromatiales bacterium]|nr:flagellar basal body M-ring protein FliF [Chromatiales bacterium]
MELAKTEDTALKAGITPHALTRNPVVRQLSVMIGIALSVALGVSIVLWSQTPNYSLLYGNLAQKDATEVIDALQKAGIDYKVDPSTGAVMVPTADVQKARMKLAGQGLPQGEGLGFELLQQETGFGTSRALEAARFQRALEGELARTIATLTNVESARVHLANPKQSVFVRKRKAPSASVTLRLYSGRTLDKGQVEAIVHLVASAVPELTPEKVTVVDQKGRLLSNDKADRAMGLTTSQLEYTQNLERRFKQRIEDLLTPILGAGKVRAEVTADLDFTVVEKTQESYNPDLAALRSEQIDEQQSRLSAVQGVPGALSNQPPAAAGAPEKAKGAGAESGATGEPLNTTKRATRNYELDRTLSHTRLAPGSLRRLSVAVVMDDEVRIDAEGNVTRVSRSAEEITRITSLVREAIGFNAARGDSIQVINSSFHVPPPPEPLPEPPLWEQPWFWDAVKQGGGVLLVLLLIFGVLRPTMKRLTTPPVHLVAEGEGDVGDGSDAEGDTGEGSAGAIGEDGKMRLSGPQSYEETLESARQIIADDPKRVAQVVKHWVSEDG